jgi:hypothetical protein
MRTFGVPAFQISIALFIAILAAKMPIGLFVPGDLLAFAASSTLFAGLVAFGKALRSDSLR